MSGGLADTVIGFDEAAVTGEAATGVKFAPVTSEALAHGLRTANLLFNDKVTWHRLQQAGMATDVSWHNRAGRYAALYRELVSRAPLDPKHRWRSVHQIAGRDAVDVGEAAIGIALEIETCNEVEQPTIGTIGDRDRQRLLVKGLDVVANETAQQPTDAALLRVVLAQGSRVFAGRS